MKFEVSGGSFSYGNSDILQAVSFSLQSSDVLAVLGPNGVGKTTLLKCMMGLLNWKTGESRINDIALSEIKYSDVWKKISYVPQAKTTTLSYTAQEMVLMGRSSRLGLFTQPSEKDRKIAENAMEMVGIKWLEKKHCSQMSGGELQMVLIARALCAQPEMLVLDEPESNLDFKNQLIVLETIQRLSQEQEITCIVNTHYPAHALKIANKALILNRDGSSCYGAAAEIVSEENLKKAFSVEVKIGDFWFQNENYKNVIPIRVC
ncbi:MAG: ABC transporter ATP-binding protein [Lachnospiraceae bacterium]